MFDEGQLSGDNNVKEELNKQILQQSWRLTFSNFLVLRFNLTKILPFEKILYGLCFESIYVFVQLLFFLEVFLLFCISRQKSSPRRRPSLRDLFNLFTKLDAVMKAAREGILIINPEGNVGGGGGEKLEIL